MKIEQLNVATTTNEMRIEINRVSRYDPLIYHSLMAAEHLGLSGEDKYVILAYNALRDLAVIKQRLMDMEGLIPPSVIFLNDDDKIKRPSAGHQKPELTGDGNQQNHQKMNDIKW